MPETEQPRFEVRMHEQAQKEYKRLDGSVGKIVNKKIEELEYRADGIGKQLKGDLAGYREIKLKDSGIRIVYEITGETVNILEVVNILTIGKRASDEVFKNVKARIASLKAMSKNDVGEYLKGLRKWRKKN